MGNFNRGGGGSRFGGDDRGGDRRGGDFRGREDRGGFGGGSRFGGRDREERQMFQAVCTQCGNACEVPFKPTGSKPVLCRDCFRGARSDDRGGRDSGSRDFGRREFSSERPAPAKSSEHFDLQFAQLNEKLDRILKRLTPSYMREQSADDATVETTSADTVSEEIVELAKPKKVSKKKAKKETKE